MLKIKDNVDLKELEKYGFSKKVSEKCYVYTFNDDKYDISLIIFGDTRKIIIYGAMYGGYEDGKTVEPMLYDLIQAGLVEKVEE